LVVIGVWYWVFCPVVLLTCRKSRSCVAKKKIKKKKKKRLLKNKNGNLTGTASGSPAQRSTTPSVLPSPITFAEFSIFDKIKRKKKKK
jgi:hypothetical protein